MDLYRSRYWLVTRDESATMIRATRTSVGFETLEALQYEYDALNSTLDQLGRRSLALLVDLREGPLRSDPQFESAVRQCRQTMTTGFQRTAVLVRSAVGRLQVVRHAREDGSGAQVFEQEAEAMAHVLAKP